MIVAVAASLLGNKGTISDEDRARLLLAGTRITDAMEACLAGTE
jgi:hypothetical protein